jgi:hypothetical protein
MNDKEWAQIVGKAWADDKFRQQLLANPAAVLKENGITLPAGVTVNVLENMANPSGELSEEELTKVAGGGEKEKVRETTTFEYGGLLIRYS